ncbi:MAG: VWA domain-containing protein [Microthrixaceae bacterium]|nr:VWA domain-containing protein [Microthrixaceae bacterium]
MSVRHVIRGPVPRSKRERSIAVAAVLGLLAMLLSYLPSTAVSATPAEDGNPDLPQKCGLDMTIIIDRSGSIGSYNDDMIDAANALIDGVSNTGSKVQVISFATTATAVTLAGGVGSSNNIGDLRLLPAEDVNLTKYTSSGGTNWDDALEMARRQPAVTPLTVVLTDGNPTYHNTGSGVNGHGNSVGGTGYSTSATDLAKAVAEADLLKAAGTHMLAVGIGDDINTANLEKISGDERLTANNGMSFAEADWTTVGFSQLKGLLEDFVKELCAPSLNITKTEIPLSGPERLGDGWTFGLDLASAPQKWENPTQPASNTSASQVTDDGKVNFKWEQGATGTMGATVTEQPRDGWLFSSATCERRNYDTGVVTQLTLTPQTNSDGSVQWAIPGGLGPADSVNCNVRNREVAPGRIDVRKITVPANMPGKFDFTLTGPGPVRELDDLTHGDTESFGDVAPGTYAVSEGVAANYSLTSAVCDNVGTQAQENVDAGSVAVAEGEHWLCTFTNTADQGSITVRKVAQGADGTFAFESDFNGDFQLTTTGGAAQTGAVPVSPGTYSVVESGSGTVDPAVRGVRRRFARRQHQGRPG